MLVSDGQPADSGYYGTAAEEDLRGVKQEYQRKGILFVAAAIGADKDNIERIYGDSFLDITDLNKLPGQTGRYHQAVYPLTNERRGAFGTGQRCHAPTLPCPTTYIGGIKTMDVIIRNDLFTSYTGLIERVMRTNHRMLCTLSMEMEDIYQELSLAVLRALDSYEEQRATTMDAHVWMTLQCALADLKSDNARNSAHSNMVRQPRTNNSNLMEVLSNDRLWQALSRLDPRERESVLEYLEGQPIGAMQSPDAVSPQQRKSCVTSTCPSMW